LDTDLHLAVAIGKISAKKALDSKRLKHQDLAPKKDNSKIGSGKYGYLVFVLLKLIVYIISKEISEFKKNGLTSIRRMYIIFVCRTECWAIFVGNLFFDNLIATSTAREAGLGIVSSLQDRQGLVTSFLVF